MRIGAFWRFVRSEPLSFWAACAYLVVEYVRPQMIYPVIDVLPWGRTTILLALVAMLLEGKLPKLRTSAGAALLLFAAIVLASSVFAFRPDVAIGALDLFLVWVLVFLIITNVVTTEGRFLVFVLLFLLASFKLSQHGARTWAATGFAWRGWGVTGPLGWFNNPGELGIQLCIFLPMSVAFMWGLKHRWSWWKVAFFGLMPLTALISIVGTNSRGAQLGVLAVLAWWLAFVVRRFRTLVVVAVVVVAGVALMPEEQLQRFDTAGEDRTSENRLERWEEGIEKMNTYPVLGIGYGNWGVYRVQTGVGGPGLSHNIFVEAGSELGYSGLFAFILLIGVTFSLNRKTRRLARSRLVNDRFLHSMAFGLDGALVAFLSTGFFVTVLYYPYFWINLALTVSLHLATRHKHVEQRRAQARSAHEPGAASGLSARQRPSRQPAPLRAGALTAGGRRAKGTPRPSVANDRWRKPGEQR